MEILAIDPGTKSGLAYVVDGRIEDTKNVKGEPSQIKEAVQHYKFDILAIEDQFFRFIKALQKLSLVTGYWIMAAHWHQPECKVVKVSHTKWKSYFKLAPNKRDYLKTAEALSKRKLSEDEAAAVLIGLYVHYTNQKTDGATNSLHKRSKKKMGSTKAKWSGRT